jgi:hypothetical protein
MSEPVQEESSPSGSSSSPPPYMPQHVYSRDAFLAIRTGTSDTTLSLTPGLPLASPRAKERWTLRLVHNDWAAAAAMGSAPIPLERPNRTLRLEAGGRRQRKSGPSATERPGASGWKPTVSTQLPNLVPVSEDWLKPHPLLDPGLEVPLEEAGKETKDGDEFMDGFLERARRGEDLLDIAEKTKNVTSVQQHCQEDPWARETAVLDAPPMPLEADAPLIAAVNEMRLTDAEPRAAAMRNRQWPRDAEPVDTRPPRATIELWNELRSTLGPDSSLSENKHAWVRQAPGAKVTATAEPSSAHQFTPSDASLNASRLGRWTTGSAGLAGTSAPSSGSMEQMKEPPASHARAMAREHDDSAQTLSPSVLAFFNQVRAQAAVPPGVEPPAGPPAGRPAASGTSTAAEAIGPQPVYGDRSLFALFGNYSTPPLNQLGPPPGFPFAPGMEPFGNPERFPPMPPPPPQQQQHYHQQQPATTADMPPQPPPGHVYHMASLSGRGAMPPASAFGPMAPGIELRRSHEGSVPQPSFLATGPYPAAAPQNGPPGHHMPFHNGPAPFDARPVFHQTASSMTPAFYRDQRWPPDPPYQP